MGPSIRQYLRRVFPVAVSMVGAQEEVVPLAARRGLKRIERASQKESCREPSFLHQPAWYVAVNITHTIIIIIILPSAERGQLDISALLFKRNYLNRAQFVIAVA